MTGCPHRALVDKRCARERAEPLTAPGQVAAAHSSGVSDGRSSEAEPISRDRPDLERARLHPGPSRER